MSSEQGLDEWGAAGLVPKKWGGATAESLVSFFSKGAEKMDLPALTAAELEQAVYLEIQIGDPGRSGHARLHAPLPDGPSESRVHHRG